MAEALAALGIAVNVMGVITFCRETADLAVKIHKTGAVDPDLAQRTTRIKALSEQLDVSTQTAQYGSSRLPAHQELSAIAKDCSSTAQQLVEELESISTGSSTIKKVAKSFWKRSKLEKLEKILESHQRVLDSRLLVDLL
jgi:hypothetical protein